MICRIISVFDQTQSIKATAKECGCSWNRVVKILSSSGIVINDTHQIILDLHAKGKAAEEIARQTGYSLKTVQSYLPATRPFYGIDISENAKAIKRCRDRKNDIKKVPASE